MSARKTLLLAVVLLAAVYVLMRDRPVDDRIAFAKLQATDISSIDMVRRSDPAQSQETYTLVREGESKEIRVTAPMKSGNWRIAQLPGDIVDSVQVDGLVDTLRNLSVEGPLEDSQLDQDVSVYGIDKPALTTVVHERDGVSTELAFGKKNEYLMKRYVKISGRSGIFLSDEAAFTALNKGTQEVRSASPYQFSPDDVREIIITSNLGQIKIGQPSVGEWRIREPRDLPASSGAVNELISAIKEISVERFIEGTEENRSQYGFGTPRAGIIVVFRENIKPNQVSFQLANKFVRTEAPAEMFVTSSLSPTILKLKKDPSDNIVKGVDEFREKRVLNVGYGSIDRVVSSGDEVEPVDIKTQAMTWTVNGKESDPDFVEQYLKDLSNLNANAFPQSVPAGAFDKPWLVLTLTLKEKKDPVLVTIGQEFSMPTGEKMRYVQASGSDTVYLIREIEAKRLVPREEVLIAPATPTAVPQKTNEIK